MTLIVLIVSDPSIILMITHPNVPNACLPALDSLGLSKYKEEAEAAFEEAKEQAKFRRLHSASYKFKNTNMSQEELYQLQMQMFQEVRCCFVTEFCLSRPS